MWVESWSVRCAAMLLAPLLLVGCAAPNERAVGPSPAVDGRAAVAAMPADPALLRFLAEEGPGVQTIVADAEGRIQYYVTIEEAYHAASGRACKRLRLEPPRDGGAAEQRVACRTEDGWYIALPLRRNGTALGRGAAR